MVTIERKVPVASLAASATAAETPHSEPEAEARQPGWPASQECYESQFQVSIDPLTGGGNYRDSQLHDYQLQLLRLEQQNKMRLRLARDEQQSLVKPCQSTPYQLQLLEVEAGNKKRLRLAREEQQSLVKPCQPTPYQLLLLEVEAGNKKRLRLAREEQHSPSQTLEEKNIVLVRGTNQGLASRRPQDHLMLPMQEGDQNNNSLPRNMAEREQVGSSAGNQIPEQSMNRPSVAREEHRPIFYHPVTQPVDIPISASQCQSQSRRPQEGTAEEDLALGSDSDGALPIRPARE
ncbi:uncharacterized protein BP5553_09287 [Venustampulla echinocandica]|uniref:Uncharacterized protein n=1 Tax=Venustampulla echinocandica TaxID=2656787 RepID=A0A370TCC2_9HELO|nr:uncharacterized protein BP5553_09287 [Venustampulla echinocandica]RDL31885.1 hypothetical protein BP5553_09287 [Venustampulla echinocandica]